MGGFDYPNKINDINENILKIMECVNKSMDENLEKEKYLELVKKYDIDRNWNDLNDKERNLLEKIFDIKDIKKDIDFFKYMEELEKRFIELKKEINLIKEGYNNGFNR